MARCRPAQIAQRSYFHNEIVLVNYWAGWEPADYVDTWLKDGHFGPVLLHKLFSIAFSSLTGFGQRLGHSKGGSPSRKPGAEESLCRPGLPHGGFGPT